MDRGTWTFWTLISALLGASAFFAHGAEQQRRAALHAQSSLASGDIVRLGSVVDGDTLLVSTEGGQQISLRLIGVKAFESTRDKDPAAPYGQAAIDALRRLLEDKPARVLVHDLPADKHGRALAMLYVEGHDVGLELIRKGHALAYTVYPFPAMTMYVEAQERARAEREGLWANPDMAARADALAAEWRRQAP